MPVYLRGTSGNPTGGRQVLRYVESYRHWQWQYQAQAASALAVGDQAQADPRPALEPAPEWPAASKHTHRYNYTAPI